MPYRPGECACPPECPVLCHPGRLCDDPECPCYQMWGLEMDLATEQASHLSAEEIHRMAIEAWQ